MFNGGAMKWKSEQCGIMAALAACWDINMSRLQKAGKLAQSFHLGN